jgi:hypothetical protein
MLVDLIVPLAPVTAPLNVKLFVPALIVPLLVVAPLTVK